MLGVLGGGASAACPFTVDGTPADAAFFVHCLSAHLHLALLPLALAFVSPAVVEPTCDVGSVHRFLRHRHVPGVHKASNGLAWLGLAWFGLAWHGMACVGMQRHGMAWWSMIASQHGVAWLLRACHVPPTLPSIAHTPAANFLLSTLS